MKNPNLYNQILLALSRRRTGMSEKTLKAETVVGYDDPTLTTDEFRDALFLEEHCMVETFEDLMGEPLWAITETGLARLREKGL
ncbi:MAG: hypothetical protein IKE55_01350 [Kiritimatiellae bacterium]|nr:hypothetical protein [Kiritimatiellia bacterium]